MAKKEEVKRKEGTIIFSERMTVKATKKAKHLTPGEEYHMHPVAAKKLIAKGYATEVK